MYLTFASRVSSTGAVAGPGGGATSATAYPGGFPAEMALSYGGGAISSSSVGAGTFCLLCLRFFPQKKKPKDVSSVNTRHPSAIPALWLGPRGRGLELSGPDEGVTQAGVVAQLGKTDSVGAACVDLFAAVQ
jgi:hypothetical protein